MEQIYEVVSVKDGKFHCPANPTFEGKSSELRDPRMMKCGRSLVPYNFFPTVADADRHTGGRINHYLCSHCQASAIKHVHEWQNCNGYAYGLQVSRCCATCGEVECY